MGRRRRVRQEGTVVSPLRKRRRAAPSYKPLVSLGSVDEVKRKKRPGRRRIRVDEVDEDDEIVDDPIQSCGLTTPRPPKQRQVSLCLSKGRKTKPHVAVNRRFSFSESPNIDPPHGTLYKHPPLLAPTIEDEVQSTDELPTNHAPPSAVNNRPSCTNETPKIRISSPSKRPRSRSHTPQDPYPSAPSNGPSPPNEPMSSESRGSFGRRRVQAAAARRTTPPQFSIDISPDSVIGHGVLAAHPPLMALTCNSAASSERRNSEVRNVEKVPFPESQVDEDEEDEINECEPRYDVPETPPPSPPRESYVNNQSIERDADKIHRAHDNIIPETPPLSQNTEKVVASLEHSEKEATPQPRESIVPETPPQSQNTEKVIASLEHSEKEAATRPRESIVPESPPQSQEFEDENLPIGYNEIEVMPQPCVSIVLATPSQSQEKENEDVPRTPSQPQILEEEKNRREHTKVDVTSRCCVSVIPETPAQLPKTLSQYKENENQMLPDEVAPRPRVSIVPETPAHQQKKGGEQNTDEINTSQRRRVSFVPETPMPEEEQRRNEHTCAESNTPKKGRVKFAEDVNKTPREENRKSRRVSMPFISSQLDYGSGGNLSMPYVPSQLDYEAGATVTPSPPRFVEVPGFPQSLAQTQTQSSGGEYISATPPVASCPETPKATIHTGYSTIRRRYPESHPHGKGKVVVPETPETPDERCVFALRLMNGQIGEQRRCTPTPDTACRKALQLMRQRAARAARPTVYDSDDLGVVDWGTRVQFSNTKSPRVTPIGYRDDVPAGLLAIEEAEMEESD